MTIAKTMSPKWISRRRNDPSSPRRRLARAVGTWAGVSVTIEHPEFRHQEVEGREQADDREQEPRQGRGVAHVEGRESAVVEVERVEQRGVRGPALAARDDERLCERLERVDDLQHQVEEDDRGEQRDGDVEESAHRSRAVDPGGLV